MSDKINQIKALIGTDFKIAEDIMKYCQKLKNKNKILNMKSYVLEKIDKSYDINIIEKYLDTITNLKHDVTDNTKDCHHEIKISSKFKINGVLVDFMCDLIEDDGHYFMLEIDKKSIINDEFCNYDYCMIKRDDDINNFNLRLYIKLNDLSIECSHEGSVDEEKEDKKNSADSSETSFDEKDYIDYDKNNDEKGVIDLKLFVEVCKNKFPDANPVHMFDMIMLCLIYCYRL